MSDAFIATFRRFIARRGKPKLLWSDHGSNFIGAKKELKELFEFLKEQRIRNSISQFCSVEHIEWNFIPEKAPHFGGLWESAVKSMKYHIRRVAANVKLTYEEYSTVLAQVEACLNSRPLVSLPSNDDGVSVLTPSHFLIGRPMEALPDSSYSYRPLSAASLALVPKPGQAVLAALASRVSLIYEKALEVAQAQSKPPSR